MQNLVKQILTIAKEGTTVEAVTELVKAELPGLRQSVLEGLTDGEAQDLVQSTPALKRHTDSQNSKAVETWRANHLQQEIEKAVAKQAPLTSIEDIKKRLASETDPTQRAILEAKLDSAIARQEVAEAKKTQEEATTKATQATLRSSVVKALHGKLPEGVDESIYDRLVGDDEEATTAPVEALLGIVDGVRTAAFTEFEKGAARPGAGGGDDRNKDTMTRQDFDAMSPQAQLDFAKNEGVIRD